ncbi:hypothetical protein BS47DRAFT_1363836 [Hydnum rufescens UP504]|uniref:Uncharacterized protein n=1 Tax=Hydnum rufescens UP504 TaxID=1448309 RepID=A0A9P6AV85_9AGAM|nr:hypothetical protein BS47DRAFT_1363836 [Hydnum rufescens UP504]
MDDCYWCPDEEWFRIPVRESAASLRFTWTSVQALRCADNGGGRSKLSLWYRQVFPVWASYTCATVYRVSREVVRMTCVAAAFEPMQGPKDDPTDAATGAVSLTLICCGTFIEHFVGARYHWWVNDRLLDCSLFRTQLFDVGFYRAGLKSAKWSTTVNLLAWYLNTEMLFHVGGSIEERAPEL